MQLNDSLKTIKKLPDNKVSSESLEKQTLSLSQFWPAHKFNKYLAHIIEHQATSCSKQFYKSTLQIANHNGRKLHLYTKSFLSHSTIDQMHFHTCTYMDSLQKKKKQEKKLHRQSREVTY